MTKKQIPTGINIPQEGLQIVEEVNLTISTGRYYIDTGEHLHIADIIPYTPEAFAPILDLLRRENPRFNDQYDQFERMMNDPGVSGWPVLVLRDGFLLTKEARDTLKRGITITLPDLTGFEGTIIPPDHVDTFAQIRVFPLDQDFGNRILGFPGTDKEGRYEPIPLGS